MKLFHRIALPALALLAAVMVMGATTSAIYLHHQRSDLASLEADLQNREIGLDFADKTAVGKFADGTKFHLLSQEMPNAALTGTLNVTGNTTLGAGLTLSAQTANRPLWTNGTSQATTNAPTGSGTTLVLQTSPSITTPTISSPTGTGTWALPIVNISGRTTLTDSLIGASQRLTGNLAAANGTFSGPVALGGDVTMSSTLGVTGVATFTAQSVHSNGLLIPNAVQIVMKNSSGTNRNVLGLNASNNLEIGGTVDGGLTFLYGLGNTAGSYNSSGAWTLNTPVSVSSTLGVTGVATFTGTINAAAITASGTVTADTLVSSKFYAEGSFTATLTGCTTSPTGTVRWVRVGKMVTITIPAITGTSNSTDATLTGMPSLIWPAHNVDFHANIWNNSVLLFGGTDGFYIGTGGVITLFPNLTYPGGFTASGTKGFHGVSSLGAAFSYTLQ